jgi:hypothetical protein
LRHGIDFLESIGATIGPSKELVDDLKLELERASYKAKLYLHKEPFDPTLSVTAAIRTMIEKFEKTPDTVFVQVFSKAVQDGVFVDPHLQVLESIVQSLFNSRPSLRELANQGEFDASLVDLIKRSIIDLQKETLRFLLTHTDLTSRALNFFQKNIPVSLFSNKFEQIVTQLVEMGFWGKGYFPLLETRTLRALHESTESVRTELPGVFTTVLKGDKSMDEETHRDFPLKDFERPRGNGQDPFKMRAVRQASGVKSGTKLYGPAPRQRSSFPVRQRLIFKTSFLFSKLLD